MKVKTYRKLHRVLVPVLVLFFLIVSVTGLVLAWKKHSTGILLPETEKGASSKMDNWLQLDSLSTIAALCLKDSISGNISARIAKIDIRPQKGIAKFIFEDHYYEIQLDCTDGKILSVGKRNSDWIEEIHDGSIVDRVFDLKGDPVKVFYSTIIALASLFMSITGIIIWNKRRKKLNIRK
ncbi:MAG: hypothetical protein B6I20_07070 [Bacteroidetes bacterium 4572_117]|nr:MAG: hypothetical protein B6I20_07070 [Bacteroidetes bacterium 4572_117]